MKMVVPKRSLVWEMLPPLLCVLAWCQTVSEVGGCGFVGLLSSCSMTVGGIELQASARINHCHSPIDITFLLQSINNQSSEEPPIRWKYTYVTSNQPESLEIPGSDRRILLHLSARVNRKERTKGRPTEVVEVPVKAQFLVDGQTTTAMTLVDETVRVTHFDDCVYLAEERAAGRIALGAILGVTALCLAGMALLCFLHRRRARRPDDEVTLVSNMEGRNSSSSLSQRPPPPPSESSEPPPPPPPQKARMEEASVKYVVPNGRGKEEGEEHELKVWVSTSSGLRRVERQASSNSDRTNNSNSSTNNSNNSPSSSSSASSRSRRRQQDGFMPQEETVAEDAATPTDSTAQGQQQQQQKQQQQQQQPEAATPPPINRSLGAIPKGSRRPQQQHQSLQQSNSGGLGSSGNSDTASNSSSFVSR